MTYLHTSGRSWRHQTHCSLVVDGLGVRDVDTTRPYKTGQRLPVRVLGGQVSDPRLMRGQGWFLAPAPLIAGLLVRKRWPNSRTR